MNLAIVGFGQMGQMVASVAQARGHQIAATVDPVNEHASHKALTPALLKDIDVCIEFTVPQAVLANIKSIAETGTNMVIGTTGWYNKIDTVKQWISAAQCGLIHAPNFSLGVNLFYRILETTSDLMNKFNTYDIAGIEYHHNRKADSPSGTAKKIAEILISHLDRKKEAIFDRLDRRIEPDKLQFASVRCGTITGIHKVLFDSEADTIELIHTAHNRRGFALGAAVAAEWIVNKKGIYTVDHLLQAMLNGEIKHDN
jgi:4-hydroxy-tetrahydrodipicolinate reductase